MLKQQAKLFNRVSQILDITLVITAFWLAHAVRTRLGSGLDHPLDYLWVMLVVLPAWHFLMSKYALYASIRTIPAYKIVTSLLKVHLYGGVIATSAIYLIDPRGFSRGLFALFILFSYILLVGGKLSLKGGLSYLRRRGFNTRNILIIGGAHKRKRFVHLVREHAQWGLCITGIYQPPAPRHPEENSTVPVLAGVDELVEICKRQPVDEVVFCLYRNEIKNLDDYVFEMEQMGITVRMVLDVYEVARVRRELSLFHDEMPMLTFHCMTFDAGQLFLKQCLDFIGALVGLCITAVLFPFIAVAIKLDSPGPLLFGQKRVGEHGRLFTCWKFRSMYSDAEERKKELAHLNEMNGAIFKIKDDPRITRVGRFLRKTSLDELPQFWSVLRGDMSLVGTRPPTPDEVANYKNWHRRRISIKPGITGLWQISGRNQIQDFDTIVRLDLEYIDQWNIWLDIRILLKTIKVVFVREGSC
jgi:exopolysaccharide biosynthesis polyprenyl glycosylphosphotransferase